MATYYLAPTGNDSTGSGSSGSPWKTAEKAYDAMSPGDTCIFKNGTYLMHQGQGIANKLSIRKANTTWKAETTGQVILRGNWGPWLLTDTKPPQPTGCLGRFAGLRIFMPNYHNYFPGGGFMIGISATDVRIEGLTIECISGDGIMFGLGSDRTVVKDCSFYWTLDRGLLCYPGGEGTPENQFPTGIVLDGNRSVFASVACLDIVKLCEHPKIFAGVPKDLAGSAFRIGNVKSIKVRNNIVEYSYGEGIDLGKLPTGTADAPCIIENNTVHDCRHVQMYVVHGRHLHVRNNISYAIGGVDFWNDIADGTSGPAYKMADESPHEFPISDYVYFYNNLGVNTTRLIEIAGAKQRQEGEDQGRTWPREGVYVGGNTFVAGPMSEKAGINFTNGLDVGIYENNLMLYEDSPTNKMGTSVTGGMTIRKNAWTEEPDATLRGTGRIVTGSANMGLGDPRRVLRATGFDYYDSLAEYDAGYSNNFDPLAYQITDSDSPLVDAAGTRAAVGTFWPPLAVFEEDILGNARSSPGDIGAFEQGGAVANRVTSQISATVTSGPSPLTTTLSSISTDSGDAVINSWLWDFGNGTTATTAGPHTKTYTTAGTYTVQLTVRDTVRNLSSVDTQTITVTEVAATGRAMDAVRVALPTTTGNFSISFALGGAVPDLVLLFLTSATATATKTDGALFGMGALTATGQWAKAIYSGDNLTTTNTKRYYSPDSCLLSIDATAVTGKAVKGSFTANTATLNITDAFPAGYLLVAVALSDPAHQARTGEFNTATATEVAIGFTPDFGAVASTFQTNTNTIGNSAHMAFGLFGDPQKITKRWAGAVVNWSSQHNQADSVVLTRLDKGDLGNIHAGKMLGIAAQGGGLSIDRAAAAGISGRAAYAVMTLGGHNQASVYAKSPNTTGTVAYQTSVNIASAGGTPVTEIIEPGMLFIAAVPFDADLDAWEYDAWTLAIVDSGSTFAMLYADKGDAATSDTWTRAENTLAIRDGAGTLKAAGTVTLTSTGFSINWTTVSATDDYSFYAVALRKAGTIAGPVAGFAFAVGDNGTVQFTDTSNAGGLALTREWDFGDGARSDDANPEHTYAESGTYNVRLTVTTSAGSDSVIRAVTVTAGGEGEAGVTYVGPFDPMTVTNYSANQLHIDPLDDDFMRLEMALNLDALVIDATPQDKTSTVDGKVRIVADLTNNRLKVIYPNGTVKYITLGNS